MGADNQIIPPAVLMLMQEGSMHNAIQLKFSMWDEELADCNWVLLRKELKIYRYAEIGDKVRVITYPAGIARVFAYRDFWILDEKGETLACAASTWTLMNLKTRRMSSIPQRLIDMQEVEPGQNLPLPAQKLKLPGLRDIYKHRVGHYDIDWNGHVNNVVTSRLLLQGIPNEVHQQKKLSSFTIHLKSEVLPNQELTIALGEEDGVYYHALKSADDTALVVASSVWT